MLDRTNHFLQEFVSLCIRLTGIPWILREVYARRKVTIINYHDPTPEVFEKHMASFSRLYSFVSIDQVVSALKKKTFSSLPPKPLLLTIDDGYIRNACLFSIIQSYNVPAVIYAVAGVVGTKHGFWFDRLPHDSQEMKVLKSMPDTKRREWLKIHYGHNDESVYEKPSALTIEQLKEFISIGGTIGSHTLFHPLLNKCDDEVAINELVESRRILENALGVTVRHFALPNGNMDIRVKDWLNKAGYLTCRSIRPGFLLVDGDLLSLPCFGIADNASSNKALLQASGVWYIFKRILG